jgi:hypothetical protein
MISKIFTNTLVLTLIFIILSSIIAILVKRLSKDKCLKSFRNNNVNLEDIEGNVFKGIMRLESTGFELEYQGPDDQGSTSYILYKGEYGRIAMISRYHDELTQEDRKERDKELERTYHPGFFARIKRRIINFLKTIKDSIMEIINTILLQVKGMPGTGQILSSQDKYVGRIQQSIAGGIDASFEPLLEKHIGKIVIAVVLKGNESVRLQGILKEYTAEFIELLNVKCTQPDGGARCADIIIPRKAGIVRHGGE